MYYVPGYIKIINNKDSSINLINTYTDKEIAIEEEYKDCLYNIIFNGSETTTDEVASFLHANGFLLKQQEFNDEIHSYYEENDDFLRLILMPTEGCNFRCTYCYENHSTKEDTLNYEAIFNFFKMKLQEKKWKCILINWFGGEPLLKINEIKTFSNMIKPLRTNYKIISSITTNGYTLTNSTISLLDQADILNYQITVDGESQNLTRVLTDGSPTYSVIMENIKFLKRHLIQSCQIRVNITDTSSNNKNFYQELANIIQDDDRFSLDIHKVFESDYYKLSSYDALNSIHAENISIAKSFGLKIDLDAPNTLQCYGAQKNCYTFRPNGSIVKCTVALNDEWNQIGKISNQKVQLNSNNKTDCLVDLSKCLRCINIKQCRALTCSKRKNELGDCQYEQR